MFDFFLVTMLIASLTQTFLHASIFDRPRRWLHKYMSNDANPRWLRTVAFMPTCQYCLSHWIGFVAAPIFLANWPLATFPAIWLANHSMAVYNLLSGYPNYLGALMRTEDAKARALQAGIVEV